MEEAGGNLIRVRPPPVHTAIGRSGMVLVEVVIHTYPDSGSIERPNKDSLTNGILPGLKFRATVFVGLNMGTQ